MRIQSVENRWNLFQQCSTTGNVDAMTDDLIAQLKIQPNYYAGLAAREIEQLRAEKAAWQGVQQGTASVVKQLETEIARLREALVGIVERCAVIADSCEPPANIDRHADCEYIAGFSDGCDTAAYAIRAARAAMGESDAN